MGLEREKASRMNYIIKLKAYHNTQHSFSARRLSADTEFLHSLHCSVVPLTWGACTKRGVAVRRLHLGFLKIQFISTHGILLTLL